jgi:hypothetical protein
MVDDMKWGNCGVPRKSMMREQWFDCVLRVDVKKAFAAGMCNYDLVNDNLTQLNNIYVSIYKHKYMKFYIKVSENNFQKQ